MVTAVASVARRFTEVALKQKFLIFFRLRSPKSHGFHEIDEIHGRMVMLRVAWWSQESQDGRKNREKIKHFFCKSRNKAEFLQFFWT